MESKTLPDRNRDRIQTLRVFTLVSVLQGPFFAAVYWMAGSKTAALVTFAAMPLVGATVWIAKRFSSPVIAGNWIVGTGYLLFLISSLYTGGLQAPALTWSIAIPIVATLICGARSGIFWFLMVAAKMSFFYFYERRGGVFIQEYGPEGYHFAFYITILGITLFALLLGLISEHYRNQYLQRIETANRELREALENIKILKELIPICAWCKKTRNDKGYWSSLEVYLEKNSDLQFSHGICPECEAKQRTVWKKPK